MLLDPLSLPQASKLNLSGRFGFGDKNSLVFLAENTGEGPLDFDLPLYPEVSNVHLLTGGAGDGDRPLPPPYSITVHLDLALETPLRLDTSRSPSPCSTILSGDSHRSHAAVPAEAAASDRLRNPDAASLGRCTRARAVDESRSRREKKDATEGSRRLRGGDPSIIFIPGRRSPSRSET